MKAVAIGLVLVLSATESVAGPIEMRCENLLDRYPGNYAIATVELDDHRLYMEFHFVTKPNYREGINIVTFDVTTADESTISAVSFQEDLERRIILDRVSGHITLQVDVTKKLMLPFFLTDGQSKSPDGRIWTKGEFGCQLPKSGL